MAMLWDGKSKICSCSFVGVFTCVGNDSDQEIKYLVGWCIYIISFLTSMIVVVNQLLIKLLLLHDSWGFSCIVNLTIKQTLWCRPNFYFTSSHIWFILYFLLGDSWMNYITVYYHISTSASTAPIPSGSCSRQSSNTSKASNIFICWVGGETVLQIYAWRLQFLASSLMKPLSWLRGCLKLGGFLSRWQYVNFVVCGPAMPQSHSRYLIQLPSHMMYWVL